MTSGTKRFINIVSVLLDPVFVNKFEFTVVFKQVVYLFFSLNVITKDVTFVSYLVYIFFGINTIKIDSQNDDSIYPISRSEM